MANLLDATGSRFFRPTDPARIRRNQRRIQVQRVFVVVRNVLVGIALLAGAGWAWRQTQSDARFAVKSIAIEGAEHTSHADLASITARYRGENLFKLDIARVQRDLAALPWVRRTDIEKQLPNTLTIRVVERRPVALCRTSSQLVPGSPSDKLESLSYIDENGVAFAELSPSVGDDDLPLIVSSEEPEIARSVALVRALKQSDPAVYTRISEVHPIAPRGFALFDRELGAFVYANAEDISAKWRSLYAIVRAENLSRSSIDYADLRFADRVIVKPKHPITTAGNTAIVAPAAAITN